ncbi:nitroreductase [Paraburkholderia sp. BL10I2N1]|uniref:nitroreductase n=1 Tax=Paraburkholderia sp. BL10I2N1 TaxID=1938796 RepID=UPI00105D222F|nr:nitroreductase [Paraburkholderia sp. BL10I2N1]TDN61402.1 nitroreductase [Paraburkholderia sp. BL10I2N1]
MTTQSINRDVEVLQRLSAGRFTCRAYQDTSVPREVIESIVTLAGRCASWCNVQPWHLVVTTPDTTAKFRDALVSHASGTSEVDSDIPFPEQYCGVYAERRREVAYRLYGALGIERSEKGRQAAQSFENFRMFGAPHVAIVTMSAELGAYAGIDCGAFIGAFMWAAQAHGVATTPQGALARHAKFIRSYFGIGDERKMVCGIAFGYADADHPANGFRTSRASLDDVMQLI